MSHIAVRDLRNDTAAVVRRVQEGEDVVLTVRGTPVARIVPVSDRSRPTMLAGEFLARLPRALADRGILADLAALGDEDTDTVGDW
jgi:prevent-host-death family protein